MFFYPDFKSRMAWAMKTDNDMPPHPLDHMNREVMKTEDGSEAERIWLDFESMTDYEIDVRIHAIKTSTSSSHNVRVLSCVNYDIEWAVDDMKVMTTDNNKEVIRFCSDAASVWNLMIEHEMSVSIKNGVWVASIITLINSSLHKNPKRAVAAMYIMKMYSEHPELLFGVNKSWLLCTS